MLGETKRIEKFGLQLVKILRGAILLRSPGAVIARKFDIKESTLLTGKEGFYGRDDETGMLIETAASGGYTRLSFDTFGVWSGGWRWRGLSRLRGGLRSRLGGQIVHIAGKNAEFCFWRQCSRRRRSAGRGWRG